MNKRLLQFFTISMVFLLVSCNKAETPSEPMLPDVTTEGKGTFGCLVNGEVWLPDSDTNGPLTPELYASYNESTDFLRVQAIYKNGNTGIEQYIYVNTETGGEGIFQIPSPPGSEIVMSQLHLELDCQRYKAPFYNTEVRILKLDTLNDIVAGTFSLGWGFSECGDSVLIEDGRFDLRYRL